MMQDIESNSELQAPNNPVLPPFYVGIGASAGGLEALEAFFTHMAADSKMAFITRFSTFGPEPEIEVVGDELAGEF